MGLFNHNSLVTADQLAEELMVHPGNEVFTVGGGQYVPSKHEELGFRAKLAFALDKGVHGQKHHVRGEYPGVVYERTQTTENAYDTFTRVMVPVKAHNFTTTHVNIPFTQEQIAEMAQEVTPETFYTQLIARAVLVAANGTPEQSNQH
jgi:hypothetical protein